ncbi:MAG: C10 family peptidase [Alistipes sp.]|nr:C10 family peptidase [Alistipes sp.]
MKKCFLTLLLVAMFSLVACNFNEAQVAVGTAETNQEAIVNGKVPFARAISNADFVFKNIESLNHKKRKVKSVDVLTKSSSRISRSSLQDEQEQPLAYVVNYENNEGYAILAANTKLPPVISIGDEGNFNTEGFVEFTQNGRNTRTGAENDLDSAQEIQYALVNNSLLLPQMDFDDVPIMGRDTTVLLKCLPLVSTKWGQGDPYNYYAPTIGNFTIVRNSAGSMPVAGAQVLASLCYHHNWRPTTQLSEDYPVDWDAINRMIYADTYLFLSGNRSAEALAVASLIRAVGEDIGADYGFSVTSAEIESLITTFLRLGIGSVGIRNDNPNPDPNLSVVDSDVFDMIIAENLPVVTSAKDSVANADEEYGFVIDGLLRLEYSVLFAHSEEAAPDPRTNLDNVQYHFDLVHINLGKNGQCDGYYHPGAFDLTEDKYREYAEEHDTESTGTQVFDLNVKYLTYEM